MPAAKPKTAEELKSPEPKIEEHPRKAEAARMQDKPKAENKEASPTETPPVRPEFKRPKRPPGIGSIPTLGSLEDLRESIEETERQARANSRDLTMESIHEWWSDYQEGISSPSVQTTFKNTNITLEDKTIMLEVGSPMAKTRILEETNLLAELRKDFHEPTLQIDFIITENLTCRRSPRS